MNQLDPALRKKIDYALGELRQIEGAVVAFSAGVDSTLLLHLAKEALGSRAMALTTVSASMPARERAEAEDLAKSMGVRHLLIESQEVSRPGFAENSNRRCFFCKSELFDHCFEAAARYELPVVVYGATADDVGDHRPGMAAARLRGARAPLLEAGLGKAEIRAASRHFGLPTWDKPAMACLSSRFPYGTRITEERLSRIEQAEEVLRTRGFRELRVRFHDDMARIEVADEERGRFAEPALRDEVTQGIRALGFRFVTLDLEPFRSGRMNEGESLDPSGV